MDDDKDFIYDLSVLFIVDYYLYNNYYHTFSLK